ncbi:hypothetical protein [Streptomyces humi]|uniref:hypothetical protein n=1 Tax=Streptomyces humi TaxID=1428620 RepID=UPI001160C64A|nr:hypothetical protein [Streptomyces humi]
MSACVALAVFFGLLGLIPAGKARGVRHLVAHGERAPGVCDYVTWDDGNASAWCSFVTPDGKNRQVVVQGYGSPRFEAGDVVEIVYWKDRPRTAVVVQNEENYRRIHIVAAIVCSVLAGVFALAAVLASAL